MQSDSSSLDTLKDNLLRAVDAEYNVTRADVVLDAIRQLEKMHITKDQLQTTRLGREINTIRQKIDAKKKAADQSSDLIVEIAQRAKKLLRSWQGLLNTSQADPPTAAAPNGESKPRLILKVKLNSPLSKRKRDADVPAVHGTHAKRRKTQVIETPTPISPVKLLETAASLPRLKTTQQLLLEMQRSEPSVLATQTSTINAILQKKIIDETLHEAVKIDYSALHKGKDLRHTNSTHLSKTHSPSVTSPSNTNLQTGSTSIRSSLLRRSSSTFTALNTNWENGSSAGSPISPLSSSSSSSLASTASLPLPTVAPEPTPTLPPAPSKKTPNKTESSDVTNLCASYRTIADLVQDHRRRMLAEHDSRELEARPELLLVPIDQLACVYERERAESADEPATSKQCSVTDVEKLDEPADLIALPFIDCPLEFDFVLDELVVQQPTIDT